MDWCYDPTRVPMALAFLIGLALGIILGSNDRDEVPHG